MNRYAVLRHVSGGLVLAAAAAVSVMPVAAQDAALPVVGVTSSPDVAHEGGRLTFSFTLSAPAPEGGLPVQLALVRDTDPQPGDVTYFVEGSRNIDGFEMTFGDDGLIARAVVTIAAGATEAVMVSEVTADDVAEGTESATFELVAGEGYTVDPEHHTIDLTLED